MRRRIIGGAPLEEGDGVLLVEEEAVQRGGVAGVLADTRTRHGWGRAGAAGGGGECQGRALKRRCRREQENAVAPGTGLADVCPWVRVRGGAPRRCPSG